MNEIRRRSEPAQTTVEILPADALPPPPPPSDRPSARPPHARIKKSERRVSLRHATTNGRGRAGWYEGQVFRESNAWILNISASGCLLATDTPPPEDCSIWLRADSPNSRDWAEVRLVSRLPSRAGIHASRMVFRGTCPYSLIRSVAFEAPTPGNDDDGVQHLWELNSW